MGRDGARPSNRGKISHSVVSNIVSGGGACFVTPHYYPNASNHGMSFGIEFDGKTA